MTMTREDRLNPAKAFVPFDIIDLQAVIWLLGQQEGDMEAVLTALTRIAYKLDLLLDASDEDMKEASHLWFCREQYRKDQ